MFIMGKVPVFGAPCHTLDTVKIGSVSLTHTHTHINPHQDQTILSSSSFHLLLLLVPAGGESSFRPNLSDFLPAVVDLSSSVTSPLKPFVQIELSDTR